MVDVRVVKRDPDTLAVSGPLVFASAAQALAQAQAMLDGRTMRLDLAEVERVDSAGLACTLAMMAAAHRRGGRLGVVHAPAGMLALARVCGVASFLGGLRDGTAQERGGFPAPGPGPGA